MKKTLKMMVAFVATLNFVACSNEVETQVPVANNNDQLRLNITVAGLEDNGSTRAVKQDWENGDKLNVWFDKNTAETPDLVLTFDGTEWNPGTLNNSRVLQASGTMSVMYEAHNDLPGYTIFPNRQSLYHDEYSFASKPYYHFYRDGGDFPLVASVYNLAYTYSENTITANISGWSIGTQVQVVVTGLTGNVSDYQLKCDQLISTGGISVNGSINPDGAAGCITFDSSSSNLYVGGVANTDGVAFNFACITNEANGKATDYTFTLKNKSTHTEMVYTATGKTMTAAANKVQGIKIASNKFVEYQHEYVDLGLSVKWATCNVGANVPEEYGDYFSWGDTEPNYTCGNPQFNRPIYWKTGKNNGYHIAKWVISTEDEYIITKYNKQESRGTVDNKTVLELADDAAHANWGGSWRMPTVVELEELYTNCTWTWTSQNGVNGCIVTGPNGNSIFLPAAGEYNVDVYNDYEGRYIHLWSSSLHHTYSLCAHSLEVYHEHCSDLPSNWNNGRQKGDPVRAVCQ